jgi:hypothetical protein
MGFGGGLKGGGGLFNGDGTLRPFTFSAIAPGDKKAGKWVYIVLAFQADGKEKVDTQHLFLGGVDQYEFKEGGDTAVSVKDGDEQELSIIGKKTPAGRFFGTLWALVEGTENEGVLPDLEAGEPLNFDGIDGLRVTLGQEKDEKGTAKRGQREGSDGNKYDRTNTIVEAVLGVAGAKTAKGSSKSASRTNGSGKSDTAVRDKADAIIATLVADALKANKKGGGEVPVSRFKMAALRALGKDSDKDAVQKLLASDDYRNDAAERGIFSYDAEGETVATA